mmetsp:Transcript_15172/g.50969  ORF Transcript_15172/g.50969 Transcript_15172/m.50969 type:complete len:218 (+) Transcript_15172:792-1445(+)
MAATCAEASGTPPLRARPRGEVIETCGMSSTMTALRCVATASSSRSCRRAAYGARPTPTPWRKRTGHRAFKPLLPLLPSFLFTGCIGFLQTQNRTRPMRTLEKPRFCINHRTKRPPTPLTRAYIQSGFMADLAPTESKFSLMARFRGSPAACVFSCAFDKDSSDASPSHKSLPRRSSTMATSSSTMARSADLKESNDGAQHVAHAHQSSRSRFFSWA